MEDWEAAAEQTVPPWRCPPRSFAAHPRHHAHLPSALCFLCAGRWDPLGLPLQQPSQTAGSAAAQVAAAALAAAVVLLPAAAAHANESPPPDGMLEFVINSIEALGPWGPAAFVLTVAVAECIPLFPTQASWSANEAAAGSFAFCLRTAACRRSGVLAF